MSRPANHVLVIGMMGSGKTTVGRRLAGLLGRPFVDSDAQVERATGLSVPQIFATSGEQAFRDEETKALGAAIASQPPAVIAVAGGAVLAPTNRELLATAGQIVWLRAAPMTLARRIGDGRGRPLLDGDPAAQLERLDVERRPLYAELADLIVDVDDAPPDTTAQLVLHTLQRHIPVELGERSYEVAVGPGARLLLNEVLPKTARRAVIVTQASIDIALDPGIDRRVVIPEGEAAKSLAVVEQLCRAFVQFGVTRADVVVGLGGGVVTDVAGFAAATYYRGIAVAHVPTTLLAQVDAAIGGKTGVNLPEGKNLVGAFHQPTAVLCDVDVLATLPEREWRSGQGEMAKYAFLGVDDLDRLPLVEQVARCVAKKAEIVAGDERESGRRATLNYGHTLAHALETAGFAENSASREIDLRHGEAVGIGLVFAARLAALLGRIDDQRVQRHLEVVRGYDLPTGIPPGVSLGELAEIMGRDKKATDGLTFVLDGPDGVETVAGVSRRTVNEALGASVPGARRAS